MRLDTSTDPQVGYRPPGPLEASRSTIRRPVRPAPSRASATPRGFGGTPAEIDASHLGMAGAVDSLLHPPVPTSSSSPFPNRRNSTIRSCARKRRSSGGSTACCAPSIRSSKR